MSSYRILIAEDQREVSRLLRSALETLEYEFEIVESPSAEDAVLESSHNSVDLLVVDYRLPGLSGVELMQKVRNDHPQVKVILITGQTAPKIRKEVAEAGADAIFLKPVPIADFLDAVERHLGLVGTIFPPEPIVSDETEEIRRGLPDLLTQLRQELDAIAVLLLNDVGRILARAGDLPDSHNEISLLSSLLSIHSAGQKVSRLIGQRVSLNCYIFKGNHYDLVFVPVGMAHAMLIIGRKLADEDQLLKTVHTFLAVRGTIESALDEAPLDSPATPEQPGTPVEAAKQDTGDFEPLLESSTQKLKPTEVDDFWERAAEEHHGPAEPDMLSYDQAKQLGLAPEDEA